MLSRPAWYNKSKQQTFENNSDRFRTDLDPSIVETIINNKTDYFNVLSDFSLEVYFGIQQQFPAAAAAAAGLWTEHQPAGETVSFSLFRAVYVFFYHKKKNLIEFLFTIFDSNYFQAIQAAGFYNKNASKMFKSCLFMFLALSVFYDKNKK